MGETRHKLEEAEYFLDQTRANIKDPKPFAFNLSAFLSAARSVTLIMQCEFTKYCGFGDWYASKQKEMEDLDFAFFNDLRRATIHIRPARPPRKIRVDNIQANANTSPSIIARHIDKDGNIVSERKSEPVEKKQKDRSRHWEVDITYSWCFEERPDDEGFELCEKYIQNLRNLVQDCEEEFMKVDT